MLLQIALQNALGSPVASSLLGLLIALTTVAGVTVEKYSPFTRVQHIALGGVVYAIVLVSIWAGVRTPFRRDILSVIPLHEVPLMLLIITGAALLFFIQWSLAAVMFLRKRLWSALVWLFGVTWFTAYAFVFVGGEGGPFFVLLTWMLAIGPATLGVLGIVAGIEFVMTDD